MLRAVAGRLPTPNHYLVVAAPEDAAEDNPTFAVPTMPSLSDPTLPRSSKLVQLYNTLCRNSLNKATRSATCRVRAVTRLLAINSQPTAFF